MYFEDEEMVVRVDLFGASGGSEQVGHDDDSLFFDLNDSRISLSCSGLRWNWRALSEDGRRGMCHSSAWSQRRLMSRAAIDTAMNSASAEKSACICCLELCHSCIVPANVIAIPECEYLVSGHDAQSLSTHGSRYAGVAEVLVE